MSPIISLIQVAYNFLSQQVCQPPYNCLLSHHDLLATTICQGPCHPSMDGSRYLLTSDGRSWLVSSGSSVDVGSSVVSSLEELLQETIRNRSMSMEPLPFIVEGKEVAQNNLECSILVTCFCSGLSRSLCLVFSWFAAPSVLATGHRARPWCSNVRHSRKEATAVEAKAQLAPQLPDRTARAADGSRRRRPSGQRSRWRGQTQGTQWKKEPGPDTGSHESMQVRQYPLSEVSDSRCSREKVLAIGDRGPAVPIVPIA